MSINQNTAKPNPPELPKKERFIRREQVLDRLNIGSTKLKALIKAGNLPGPIHLMGEHQIPGRVSYWLESQIDAYMDAQIKAHHDRVAEIANDGINGWLTQATKSVKGARHV